MQRNAPLFVLLAALILLLAANFWRLSTPSAPDPRLVDISVRSTLFALPSPTASVVEVTRIVEVTRVVVVTPAATPLPDPNSPLTPTGTITPAAAGPAAARLLLVNAGEVADVAGEAAVDGDSGAEPAAAQVVAAASSEASGAAAAPVEGPAPPESSCPALSTRTFDTIPVASGPISHPDTIHGDLNLWQRGWAPVDAPLTLVTINGPADGDPPQLAGIFADRRLPEFSAAYQVYGWDWDCSAHGCRGSLLDQPESTLLALRTAAGEPLAAPSRAAEIYGGGYRALVLYAEPTRITLGYTREDSVANGYVVHLENLCVDAALLARYRESNAAGRGWLPALRDGETLGQAGATDLMVATRDRGVFFDPRSRKDWWRGQ